MKSKQEKVAIKYSHVGDLKDFRLEVFADAAFANAEYQDATKSVMGLVILLRGKDKRVNPLHWKSKVIEKVAVDIKSAETLALETAVDDAIHLADMLTEICSPNPGEEKIPLIINEDSKSLIQSLYSTKKVKRKTMRVIVSSLQQQMRNKRIKEIHHVRSNQQIADVFTKKGVSSDKILDKVSSSTLEIDRTPN